MRLTCPNHVLIQAKIMCPDQDFLPGVLFSVNSLSSLYDFIILGDTSSA